MLCYNNLFIPALLVKEVSCGKEGEGGWGGGVSVGVAEKSGDREVGGDKVPQTVGRISWFHLVPIQLFEGLETTKNHSPIKVGLEPGQQTLEQNQFGKMPGD